MCSKKSNHKLQFTVAALQILTIEYVDLPQQQHKSENAKGRKVALSCDIQHGGVRVKKEKKNKRWALVDDEQGKKLVWVKQQA